MPQQTSQDPWGSSFTQELVRNVNSGATRPTQTEMLEPVSPPAFWETLMLPTLRTTVLQCSPQPSNTGHAPGF